MCCFLPRNAGVFLRKHVGIMLVGGDWNHGMYYFPFHSVGNMECHNPN